jgi:putative methyltransferase (TIGR04325 family)
MSWLSSPAKRFLPPILWDLVRSVRDRVRNRGRPEWQFVAEGDPRRVGDGWNATGVVARERAKWEPFRAAIDGPAPLGVAHESTPPFRQDDGAHNVTISFGYVLARASRFRDRVSLLDWGGSLGHYYLFSRALLPEAAIDYHCKELPLLCEAGRSLLPDATFHDSDEAALTRTYDLVLASGSLQYAPDWRVLLGQLASVAEGFLYVTRLPTVAKTDSFHVLQRALRHGYGTEYKGWVLNRGEFLQHAQSTGMVLDREFLVQERPLVRGAPEPIEYRGFLFRN